MATIRAPSTISPAILPQPNEKRSESITIPQILLWLLVAWGSAILLSLLIGLIWMNAAAMLALPGFITVVFVVASGNLLFAKKKAIECGIADAWFGILQVVAWDPTEGVLFLKDKMLEYVDSNPNDGGGVRVVLPFVGEEEVCRVPLEVQTLQYWDEKVLTREYVPLKFKGHVYWRIVDVARFYLLVSREVHKVDNKGGHAVVQPRAQTIERLRLRSGTAHQLEAAEEWLRSIAEEQTRSVVARVRTGLLVAEEVAAALPPGLRNQVAPVAGRENAASSQAVPSPSSSKDYLSAAEGLGDTIRAAMESVVPEYGIHVDRVSLLEVRLPEEILAKAVEACTTAYQPLVAHRQAAADKMGYAAQAEGRKMFLAGEAEVMGKDAVAKREVVGSVKPFALGGRGGLLDFLTNYFEGAQKDGDPSHPLSKP